MSNPCTPEIDDAKDKLREMFALLSFEESKELLNWANEYLEITPDIRPTKSDEKQKKEKKKKLAEVALYLKRQNVLKPRNEQDQINWPKDGYDSDCNKKNTIEIDAFLYDDDDIEQLVDRQEISRNYCIDCGSRNTHPLNFISHSLSKEQIEFIFTKLLPVDVHQVLDIGSRFGSVLYGCSIFLNGSVNTVGVEINKELVELTKSTINRFGLKNITLHSDDIRNVPRILEDSQFIIMNNVFTFFLSKSEQEECWEVLHNHVKPGTYLIHLPSIDLSTNHLQLSFKVEDWLELADTSVECIEFAGNNEDIYEEVDSIKKYLVK